MNRAGNGIPRDMFLSLSTGVLGASLLSALYTLLNEFTANLYGFMLLMDRYHLISKLIYSTLSSLV